jgi:hypothetical protein
MAERWSGAKWTLQFCLPPRTQIANRRSALRRVLLAKGISPHAD